MMLRSCKVNPRLKAVGRNIDADVMEWQVLWCGKEQHGVLNATTIVFNTAPLVGRKKADRATDMPTWLCPVFLFCSSTMSFQRRRSPALVATAWEPTLEKMSTGEYSLVLRYPKTPRYAFPRTAQGQQRTQRINFGDTLHVNCTL
jgi:hypothetical protein